MPYIIFYQKIFLCNNRKFLEKKYGLSKKTLTFNDNLKILYKNETVTYYREFEKIGKKKFLEFLGYNFKSNIEFENNNNFNFDKSNYPLFKVKKENDDSY